MPSQIYPGVFSPNFNQAPSFQTTRAKQYLTSYTEARYENWGLALKQAELSYKKDYDAYTARDKALKDLEALAHKDLTSAERTLLALQKEDRTVADRQQIINTSTENAVEKFNVGQARQDTRSSRRDAAISDKPPKAMGPGGEKVSAQTVDALFENVQSSSDIEESSKKLSELLYDDTSEARAFRAATAQRTGISEDNIGAYIAKAGTTAIAQQREKKGLPDPADRGYEQSLIAAGASFQPEIKGGGSTRTFSGSSGGNITGTPVELGSRAGAISSAEEDVAAAKAAYEDLLARRVGLVAPKPNLVESARDIYANQFETLPGYLQHKRDLEQASTEKSKAENTRALVDMFIADRKAKLGADATAEDMLAARTEGAKDALFFLQHKQLRGKAENTREPIILDGKVVGFRNVFPRSETDFKPTGFPIEATPQRSATDALIRELTGERTQEIPLSTTTSSSPIGDASDEAFDLGEEVASVRILPRNKDEMTASLALARERSAALKGLLAGVDELNPDAFQFPEGGGVLPPEPPTVKIEKRPDAELVMEEIKKKGPKVQEGRAIAAQIKDSHELSLLPKKIERLTKTTSYGPYVKDLFAANKAAKTPRNGAQLREDVIKNLPEGQREDATRLLFALMLSN